MSTLTIADLANNTGATATIAGTSGGASTVYAQAVNGLLGSGSWTAAGTRTGDGTLSLALAKGYYWAYCLTAPATLSGLAYFVVTDGAAAVESRLFAAALASLRLLALDCTARVYDSAFADDPNVQYPCVIASTESARQTDEAALNGRDDLGHPIRLLIRDVVPKFDEVAQTRFRLWRQSITRAFINQRMPGVIETIINRVEPGALLRHVPGGGEKMKNIAESELVIRCITREVRGLGA